jgi:hypothetical protein
MNYCAHGYLAPPDLAALPADIVLQAGGLISPYCPDCWAQPTNAGVLTSYFFEKPVAADPCTFGFCDLIAQVVRKRGWGRDSFAKEAKESDLRCRLMEKKSVIEAAIAGRDRVFAENYVRRVLKNQLTNDQTRGDALIVRSAVSLSADDRPSRNYRREIANEFAGRSVTDLSGGDSSALDDDRSLDNPETLTSPAADDLEFIKRKGRKVSDAKRLFDKMQAEALSQIATLTGGRTDGFDTNLDLEKALGELPEDQQNVFAAIYMENGEMLNRPRTLRDVTFLTGRTTQQARTLKRKAINALRPILGPGFFKRELGH